MLDWIAGTRRPSSGAVPVAPEVLRHRLLGLTRPSAPWLVRGGDAGEAELVAEWRIVDAAWREVFGRAGLSQVFRVLMRLDGDACAVRAMDEAWSVRWTAGVPSISLAASGSRGRQVSWEFGRGFAFSELLRPGEVYHYRFATGELKGPLQEAVLAAGWTWRGVVFGRP